MAKQKVPSSKKKPTKEQVDKFDMFQPMLQSFLTEVRELSKKKADGLLNEVKVKMINRLLVQVKDVLATDASIEYLDLLDEETLPQNSDAVLILGQYNAAMDQFKAKHYDRGLGLLDEGWRTREDG